MRCYESGFHCSSAKALVGAPVDVVMIGFISKKSSDASKELRTMDVAEWLVETDEELPELADGMSILIFIDKVSVERRN